VKNISFMEPVEELSFDTMTVETYEKTTGTAFTAVQDQTLLNVAKVAPPSKAFDDSLDWAVQQLACIEPKDAIESMLVQQMIALNSMAMDCSSRALIYGQTTECRDMNMRHAARLMNTFAKVLAALNKHRGKGQTIVVKHQQVNVCNGGQAVIGDVGHRGG